jgi:hypothetical protein
MSRKSAPIGEEFLELRHRLAEWRRGHSRRTPLPDDIWTEAVELARRHGVYRTARSLPIDYVNLRKRLNGAAPPTTVARPEFVEVLMAAAQAPAQPAACIEVLRIPVTGAVELHQLFRAWRNGGR